MSGVRDSSAIGRDYLGTLFDSELSRIKSSSREIELVVVTHRQADPDALCAASGLSHLLSRRFPEVKFQTSILAPQGASSLGENVASARGIHFITKISSESVQGADFIVAVDAGDANLLEPYSNMILQSKARKVLVDHHASSLAEESWSRFETKVVITKATSSCEIVTLGFPSTLLTKDIATDLLTGLMFDSQHLGIANEMTLEAALVLLHAGAEILDAKTLLRNKPDRSELLARIKSAQRLSYLEVGGSLILKTEVSSFHAAVARMLLDIGGDVGLAFGKSNGEARLSARSTQTFYKNTGVDLASIVKDVSNSLGLTGGGHATAASLSGAADPAVIAETVVSEIRRALLKT